MPEGKVGKVAVEVDASAERLGAGLEKAGQDIKSFANKARKDLSDVDGDFLQNLAKKAKEIRKENRATGETALEAYLGNGPRGAVNLGMEALGLGLKGLIVGGIGKTFASGMEAFSKVATGETDPAVAVNEWAKGVPIVGDFVKGWRTVLDLMSGAASEAGQMNRILKEQEMTARSIALLNRAGSQGRKLFGDEGSVEANRLAMHAANAAEREKLMNVTDGDIRDEIGPWMTLVKQMNAAVPSPALQQQSYVVTSAAERAILEKRKPLIASLANADDQIDDNAKIMLNRARQTIAAGMVGNLSRILQGFQDMPGGDSAEAQKMQKILSVYSQSMAMRSTLNGFLHDGNAGPAQKAAAESALTLVSRWSDRMLGSAALNVQPFTPMRLASAELASSDYSGAAMYAREKDQADYAKNADFVTNQKLQLEATKITNDLLTQILNMGGTPVF